MIPKESQMAWLKLQMMRITPKTRKKSKDLCPKNIDKEKENIINIYK